MMMPPNSLYTRYKNLYQSRYYLHRGVIGNNDVDMSKFPCERSYSIELSEGEKSDFSSAIPDTYIESFLEFWETINTFLKCIDGDCVTLFRQSLSYLESHLYSSSETYTLGMEYGNAGHSK